MNLFIKKKLVQRTFFPSCCPQRFFIVGNFHFYLYRVVTSTTRCQQVLNLQMRSKPSSKTEKKTTKLLLLQERNFRSKFRQQHAQRSVLFQWKHFWLIWHTDWLDFQISEVLDSSTETQRSCVNIASSQQQGCQGQSSGRYVDVTVMQCS